MKKTMSILLCVCLILGMAVASSARFSNIITYTCLAVPNGDKVSAEAHMELINVPSGAKIQLVVQEIGFSSKTTYSKNATGFNTLLAEKVTVKPNTAYNFTFTFIAGTDSVTENFVVMT